MIRNEGYAVEPWAVRESLLDLDRLGQTESIFALSNGHIGWRANLDEGEPHAIAGSYLNAVYEEVSLPYAETAYGYPEAGQTIVNVTDGKVIRLLVEDEPFDVRYGRLLGHERVLDLKAGVLRRTVDWESPSHRTVRIRSTRLVSLSHRAIAAVLYEVEPLDGPANVVLQSELVANEPVTERDRRDPRTADLLKSPLQSELAAALPRGAALIHSTRLSHIRVAAAMTHEVAGPRGTTSSVECSPDHARFTVNARLAKGRTLRIVKFVSYGWSRVRSTPAMRSQAEGALAVAAEHGWRRLAAAQRRYLAEFWARADVELTGDPAVQQGLRFAMFQVLQAAARAEQRAIPAKGLTGPGYDGHTFWDTEAYVLPVLTYISPQAVADALRWRHSILDLARRRARDLGLRGAAFPWRTIHGEECSGYWPASTAAFHINADVADAVQRYVSATGDAPFERSAGAELLIETARLWASVGHFDRQGAFRIDGVTGPDEYSAIADNNLYTNLMAQQNLRAAADVARRHPAVARRLEVKPEELRTWRRAADRMLIPYNPDLRVHEQASAFTEHERWDFEGTRPDQYPLFLHFPYFDLYRKQVVKQADLVLAMFRRGDAFTDEEKARNFAYYEAITVRDSSLSSCTQSIMAAEVGLLGLAYDYLGEAALMDLDDLEHNVRDGVHVGSLAGAWLAVVAGLGGMRHHADKLGFSPRLPGAIRRLVFRISFLGRLIKVAVDHERVTYTLLEGPPMTFRHYGETVRVAGRTPVTRPVQKPKAPAEPAQPKGREPARRQSQGPRRLRRAEGPRAAARSAPTGGRSA